MGYFKGFSVTLRQVFSRVLTNRYPKIKRQKPERAHGRHVLNVHEDGTEKCIGCQLCAGVCPANCIYVRGKDNTDNNRVSHGERYGYVYEINYLRCIHCDLCVEACPTGAITESKMFEFSFTDRSDAIYTQNQLLVDKDGQPKRFAWEHWATDTGQEDIGDFELRNTSGWLRATAPSGKADQEGKVLWSDDLGHGVRTPEVDQITRDQRRGQ